MRLIEEVGDDRGLLLVSVQPLARPSFEHVAVTWSHLAHGTLDVAVEQRVEVQISGIARQKEQLNALGVVSSPCLTSLARCAEDQ